VGRERKGPIESRGPGSRFNKKKGKKKDVSARTRSAGGLAKNQMPFLIDPPLGGGGGEKKKRASSGEKRGAAARHLLMAGERAPRNGGKTVQAYKGISTTMSRAHNDLAHLLTRKEGVARTHGKPVP